MEHLNHVNYPASKQDLVKACEGMSDVPAVEKEAFTKNLPNKVYKNAAEVKKALMT